MNKFYKIGNAKIVNNIRKNWTKKPMLTSLFWECTLKCNMNCKHCGSRAGEHANIKDELKTEEIKKAFKDVADNFNSKKIMVNITGGEPLLRKDLFEVTDYINKLGFNWGITTNGLLINDDTIEKFEETNLASISISLDGLEKTHDNFRNVRGAYKKTLNVLRKLKKCKTIKYLQVTTVVNKSNINELEEMYNILKKIDINDWRILNIDPIGRTNDNKDLLLDGKDFIKMFEFIKDKSYDKDINIHFGDCSHFLGWDYELEVRNKSFLCYSGITTGTILYNGDIVGCPDIERRPELVQGNIKNEKFSDIWKNEFKWFRDVNKLKNPECENCENWDFCKGDGTHTYNFDEHKPNLCVYKLLKEEKEKNEKNTSKT